MTRARNSRRLWLDPAVRTAIARDVVHLAGRRGTFDLVGKDVGRVHAVLAPVLDGRYTRDGLLSAAGARAPAIERYLDRLQKAGALRNGPPSEPLPAGFPQPRAGIQRMRIGRTDVAVALAGAEIPDVGELQLRFLTRLEIEQELLDLDVDRPRRSTRVCIVCDSRPDATELRRRCAISRHLLAIELGRGCADRAFSVYELAADRLLLRQLARVELLQGALPSLLLNWPLIKPLDTCQLPLVTMAAEVANVGERTICYGLDAQQVRTSLTDVLARLALVRASRRRSIVGKRGCLGERSASASEVELTDSVDSDVVISPSFPDCAQRLLCTWALHTCRDGGESVDLVSIAAPSMRTRVLQDVLRRRKRRVRGMLNERFAPLVTFKSDELAVARLGYEEVLAEALLCATAAEFGVDEPTAIACAPSLLGATSTRRRFRAALARLPCKIEAATGRFRWLGRSFFFGVIGSDSRRGVL